MTYNVFSGTLNHSQLRSICARTEENVETVNDLVLSQQDKPQTYRTVREISRETGIHQCTQNAIRCISFHIY